MTASLTKAIRAAVRPLEERIAALEAKVSALERGRPRSWVYEVADEYGPVVQHDRIEMAVESVGASLSAIQQQPKRRGRPPKAIPE
jgi:phosphopantetheine adenylyltransferase